MTDSEWWKDSLVSILEICWWPRSDLLATTSHPRLQSPATAAAWAALPTARSQSGPSHVRVLWGLKHAVENVTLCVTAIIYHPLHPSSIHRRFTIHETSLSVRNIFGSNVFICWLRAIGRRAEDIYDDNKMPVIAGHEIELTSNYINIYGFFVRFLLDRSLCRANITGRHHHRSPREPLAVNE